MHIGTDGSGTFDVASAAPGTPGVIAAVVVSERRRRVVESYVEGCCRAWGLEELHATEMSLDQLGEVCGWIGGGDNVVWTASLTDAALFPIDKLVDWRDRQADAVVEATSAVTPERVAEVLSQRSLDWHLKRVRAGGPASLPVPHFVEHVFVLPRVIGDAVQAAIDAHDGPEWQDEFDSLSVWIDDSTARDAKAQTRDLLKPILASPGLALVPPPRGRLEHPIFTKHIRDGWPADILSLIGDRINFVSSHDEPLCQLADIAAWTVRRYAERPSDENAERLYRLLRPRQHGIEGSRGVRVMSMRGIEEPMARYAHVAPVLTLVS
jgi:hypothetical protein